MTVKREKGKKRLLSTGEFAALCGVTKATLFHYDKVGLLRPVLVADNGYRAYAPAQIYAFDTIALLKETGACLEDIRRCREAAETGLFQSFLEQRLEALRRERVRLARRTRLLEGLIAAAREARRFPYDAFMVQDLPNERLEVFPTNGAAGDAEDDEALRFAACIQDHSDRGDYPLCPFGVTLDGAALLAGERVERSFFSRATRATPRGRLLVRPAGRYAVLAHRGEKAEHQSCLARFVREIAAAGLRPVGDCYGYDMMSAALPAGPAAVLDVRYCWRVA